jgi:hypothetical protein
VLATAGRTEEAAGALQQALERYERKKNLAMVAQVRAKLEELRKAAPALNSVLEAAVPGSGSANTEHGKSHQ